MKIKIYLKLKDDCSLKKSYDKPRQHIKKQRHYFANKDPCSQSYCFYSSHAQLWELDHKKLLLLLNRFSHVRLCVTPQMAAHQAPLSLGFSRQEHWSGLPFPSPMQSEKWKWSHSVICNSLRPHGLQPNRPLHPWIFQARVLEWVAIAFSDKKAEHQRIDAF